MTLLVRIANEHNINCQKYIDKYNQILLTEQIASLQEVVLEFCKYICVEVESAKTRNASDVIMLIQKYIIDNYNDSNMSLKHLSDIFKLSPSLLSKMFKNVTNENFAVYLQNIRLSRAKQLLHNSDISIAEVAEKVGYNSYLSFKWAFIRAERMSPREYREQCIGINNQSC